MKQELWGTFSVKDHKGKRPFVAEVLLYDRLMIPRPPTADEEKPEPGGKDQETEWRDNKWEPDRLRDLLDILGEEDLAIELPWGEQARKQWQNLYDGDDQTKIGDNRSSLLNATEQEIEMAKMSAPKDAPFIATAGLISQYISEGVHNDVARKLIALAKPVDTSIEPVIAYKSFNDFKNEQGLQPKKIKANAPDKNHSAMFGWEFFVPEDADETDYKLLKKTVKLAARKDLREARQLFHGLLKQMQEGGVDPNDAKEKMLKMLDEYRQVVRGSGIKTVVRYAAKIAPIIAPLSGLYSTEAGIGVGVAAGSAPLIVDWLIPKKEIDERLRPVSLVYEARKFFGKK